MIEGLHRGYSKDSGFSPSSFLVRGRFKTALRFGLGFRVLGFRVLGYRF